MSVSFSEFEADLRLESKSVPTLDGLVRNGINVVIEPIGSVESFEDRGVLDLARELILLEVAIRRMCESIDEAMPDRERRLLVPPFCLQWFLICNSAIRLRVLKAPDSEPRCL